MINLSAIAPVNTYTEDGVNCAMRSVCNLEIQRAYAGWLKDRLPAEAVAITLTFNPTKRRGVIPELAAYETIRMFCRLLNSAAYGHRFTKAKKSRLSIISVVEGGWGLGQKHPHVHMLVEAPKEWQMLDWLGAVKRTIERMETLSSRENKVEAVRDDGWLDYILKLQDKHCFSDAIDLSNLWLN